MPDPNTHADDMKSPAQYETMPSLWWLEPWTFAVQQWNARAKFYGYWMTADKQWTAADAELSILREKRKEEQQAIIDTAYEAGFEASKAGYINPRDPKSPFPLKWLGEAIAYWKGEAYAARRERDSLKEQAEKQLEETKAALSEANSAATEYRRQLDAVKSARDHAVEAAAELDGKLHREQLDHAATLGYVGKVEQKLADVKADLAELDRAIDADYAAYVKKFKRNPKAKHKPLQPRKAKPAKKKKGVSK